MKVSLPNWILVPHLGFLCFIVRPLEEQCSPISTHAEISKSLSGDRRILTIIILRRGTKEALVDIVDL